MCMHTQLCPTLWDPMDGSLPGSSGHGIFQAKIQYGLPFPPPGDLLGPGIEPMSPASPAAPSLAGGFFTTEPLGKSKLFACFTNGHVGGC